MLHRMKPVLVGNLLALWVLVALSPAWAALSGGDNLSQLETRLLSRTYPQESVEVRLSRLEETVFGTPVKGKTDDARIEAIEALIPVVPQTPKRSVPRQNAADPSDVRSAFEKPQLPEADDTEYPAISALEAKVFGEPSEDLPVEARLDQLELKVMGHMQRGSLQERTDQLRMMVLGDTDGGLGNATSQQTGDQSNPMPSSSSGGASSISDLSPSEQADLAQALLATENRILHQTYPQDTLDNRLSRLEMNLFNQPAPEMAPQDRLYRIAGVVSAQKSAKNEQMFPGAGPRRGAGGAMTFGNILLMLLMSLL